MKKLFNKIIKIPLIFAFVMMLSSCTVKSLYNQLDNLIPFYVEGMVTLDGLLEEKLQQRTAVLIGWHRNTQLSQYAQWLKDLQHDVDSELTEKKIKKHIVTLDGYWKSISLKIDEEMASLLPLLNKDQRQELFSSIDDKNDEFREEYVDINNEERIEQYTDRIIDSYETWLGDLTEEQETLIKQAAIKMKATSALRLKNRQQWQKNIKNIIDNENTKEQKTTKLREYFKDYNNHKITQIKEMENENKSIFSTLTLQVVKTMTDQQKLHFTTTSNDYILMFEELAQKS